jgi:glycerol uptake facilitator-like aquaporin
VATAFLVIAVVGSGIMAEKLCAGNIGLALLANAIATGGALIALVLGFGLQSIWGCRAHREPVTALAVGAYIIGAYWFTVSTSFANPAVTIARALTDTFAGIRPVDAPGFIMAQLIALLLALPLLHRYAAKTA